MKRRPLCAALVLSAALPAGRAGLAELGYAEGRNLDLRTWWADGSVARLEQMCGDIVAARLVDSYAHPGGKATGITLFASELAGKRMAMLKELVPGMRSVAVIANPAHPGAPRELQASRDAAARLGLRASYFPTPSVAELDAALARIAQARADAVLVFAYGFALDQAERIAAFSLRERIPVAAGWGGVRQTRQPAGLRARVQRCLPPAGELCRPHPQGCASRRPAHRAADPVRAGDQPEDGAGDRRRGAALDAAAG